MFIVYIKGLLVGRKIVFGKRSGVTVHGDIVLYSGEVRSNWLNVLNNAANSDKLLQFRPLFQRALSQVKPHEKFSK